MSACEHCWAMSRLIGVEYQDVLARAELKGWPCTKDTEEGARLRAGQWWDEATKRDVRNAAAERE